MKIFGLSEGGASLFQYLGLLLMILFWTTACSMPNSKIKSYEDARRDISTPAPVSACRVFKPYIEANERQRQNAIKTSNRQ